VCGFWFASQLAGLLRDLNLGVARGPYTGTVYGVVPIEADSGGERTHPIQSLKKAGTCTFTKCPF